MSKQETAARLSEEERRESLEQLCSVCIACEGLASRGTLARVPMVDFLEALAEGALIIEPGGSILTMNRRALEMFGYRHAEVVGQPLGLLLPERLRDAHVAHVLAFFAQPQKRPMGQGRELIGRRKDGSEFPIEVGLGFMELPTGKVALAFMVDITLRKEAEEALAQSNQELQARNVELDAFAHTVAHDLKGPLTMCIGYADLLWDSYDDFSPEEIQNYLHTVAQHGRRMSNIINELLLLASVRTEEVKTEPLEMGRIVDEALKRLAYLQEAYQAEIEYPATWPSALGYRPWLEQVWVNYISNAIKYGGSPPRVMLGATMQPQGDVQFWVRDNGMGLTPEQQQQLFTPFTRLKQIKADGHGLGLSIVKRILEKLGGQVGITSEIGRGSVFSFTLSQKF